MLADWMVAGEPHSCHLIELGPGRGTLLRDMLRVFGQFKRILKCLSVQLVEASLAMSRIQEQTLTGIYILWYRSFTSVGMPLLLSLNQGVSSEEVAHDKAKAPFEDAPYRTCTLDSGVPVSWYQRLEDVPTGW